MEFPHPLTSKDIKKIISACKKQLPVKLISELGCGDYGCAFLTDQGTVLKITKHQKEADVVRYIFENNLVHPSLPKIYDIWSWEGCHPYDAPIYLIHREDLPDLPVDATWFEEVIGGLEYELHRLVGSLTEDDIYDTLMGLFQSNPGTPQDELIAEKIGDLYVWAINNDLWLDDVIISNFGLRGDVPVVRDLGAIMIRRNNPDEPELYLLLSQRIAYYHHYH